MCVKYLVNLSIDTREYLVSVSRYILKMYLVSVSRYIVRKNLAYRYILKYLCSALNVTQYWH